MPDIRYDLTSYSPINPNFDKNLPHDDSAGVKLLVDEDPDVPGAPLLPLWGVALVGISDHSTNSIHGSHSWAYLIIQPITFMVHIN